MKKLALYSLFCLFASAFFAVNNSKAQDLSDYYLIGNVKRITEYHYLPLRDCDYCEDLRDSTIVEFNINGNVVMEKRWSYILKSELIYEYYYKYDWNGKLIEEKKNEIGNIIETTKYIRDNQGYISHTEKYMGSRWEKDRLVSKEYRYRNFREDGSIKEVSIYSDEINKTLKRRMYYNEKDLLEKYIVYENGKPSEDNYSYTYHPNGKVSKKNIILSDGRKEIYTYDKYGLRTGYSIYDKSGNILLSESYDYKYDNRGNWVYLKVVTNDAPVKTIDIYRRKITYYK